MALSGVDNPTQQQVEMAINTAVDQAFDLSSGPDDEDVQSCLSECSSLPFLDMLVCQSACLCSKFESPALGNDATAYSFAVESYDCKLVGLISE